MRGVEAVGAVVLAALGVGCTGSNLPPDEQPLVQGCTDATPILRNGVASGYVRCADGAIDRPTSAAADPTIRSDRCEGTEDDTSACKTDADCGGGPTHACLTFPIPDPPGTRCACVSSCASDADCGTNEACLPGGLFSVGPADSACVPASCHTDSDCPSGECGAWAYDNGCGMTYGLDCRDGADTCRVDTTCPTDSPTCAAPDGAWACRAENCEFGRPFVLDGSPRTAAVVARADWSAVVAVEVPDDLALRVALAARWAEVAALEHASVASFARVTLQLLALGAPADLIADTQRAGQDEVAHARFAYALAGAFGGAPRGPGALSLAAFTLDVSPEAVLSALIDEACVSETFGAAELAVAAEGARDPALAAGLRRLADDEARHAALAWRTLRWLVATWPELRGAARAGVAARTEALLAYAPGGPAAPAYGALGDGAAAVWRDAATRIVAPALAAALG